MLTKNLKSLATACLLSTQLLTFSSAFAKGGSMDGGGGNSIESNFRTKVSALAKYLVDLDSAVPGKLQFKPFQIVTNLSVTGRFEPICATGETLDFIVSQQKMAYVGAPGAGPNVISLDCGIERIDEWNRLFKSNQPGDNLLFIHEALRNNNQSSESENDYGISSSYLIALEYNKKLSKQIISNLIYPTKNSRCQLKIEGPSLWEKASCSHGNPLHNASCDDSTTIDFVVDGHIMDTRSQDYELSRGEVTILINNILSNKVDGVTDWALELYNLYDCEASKEVK